MIVRLSIPTRISFTEREVGMAFRDSVRPSPSAFGPQGVVGEARLVLDQTVAADMALWKTLQMIGLLERQEKKEAGKQVARLGTLAALYQYCIS